MAKIKLDRFAPELEKALKKAKSDLLSAENMQVIGDDLVEQIRVRTRLGNGLDTPGGEPEKLRPLSKPYVEQRKTMSLSDLTSPKKSNLTQTGKMLDDLVAKVAGTKVTITFKDPFSRDKAGWNTQKGRPFLNVSRVQVERLTNHLNTELRKILKKYF